MCSLARRASMLAFPVLLCLPQPAPAQEDRDQSSTRTTSESIFARGPLFTIQLAGPKAMHQAVLPTNLGTVLSSPECKPLRDLWQAMVQGILEEARSEDAMDAWPVLQERLLDYAGRLDIEFHVTHREVRNNRVRYEVGGHILLWPDRSTEMTRFSRELRAFMLAFFGETPNSTDLEDGRSCEFLGRPHDDGISLPIRHTEQEAQGHALVLFFGSRIGNAISGGIERLARSSEAHARRNRAWQNTMGLLGQLDVDMAQVAALIEDEFRRHERQAPLVRRFFGLGSWERAGLCVRTAGPKILTEATMDYRQGEERGLFAGLLPDITTLPKLAHVAPRGTDEKPSAFVACHLRIGTISDRFLEVVGNIFRSELRSLDEIKAEVKKELGFDLQGDLLAHLSTEVVGLLKIDEGAERDPQAPDADGLCFVMSITNQEGFAATYKKLKAHPDLRPRPAHEIQGGEAVPVRGPAGGEYIGRTKEFFFYAVGDRGLEAMTAFLRQNNKGGDQPGLPKVVQRAIRNTPPGWNAVGVLPARWLQDPMTDGVLWEVWKEIDDVFPREVRRAVRRDTLTEGAARAAPILKKYRMDRLVLLGGWEPRAAGASHSRARLRLLW